MWHLRQESWKGPNCKGLLMLLGKQTKERELNSELMRGIQSPAPFTSLSKFA